MQPGRFMFHRRGRFGGGTGFLSLQTNLCSIKTNAEAARKPPMHADVVNVRSNSWQLWWMTFQFLYRSALHFIQHLAFSPSVLLAKDLKAQMYRMSCLLKPHKLIMRSKLSFYVSRYFLLPNKTEHTKCSTPTTECGERDKHTKQLKRNLFVSTLIPSTKWNRCYN